MSCQNHAPKEKFIVAATSRVLWQGKKLTPKSEVSFQNKLSFLEDQNYHKLFLAAKKQIPQFDSDNKIRIQHEIQFLRPLAKSLSKRGMTPNFYALPQSKNWLLELVTTAERYHLSGVYRETVSELTHFELIMEKIVAEDWSDWQNQAPFQSRSNHLELPFPPISFFNKFAPEQQADFACQKIAERLRLKKISNATEVAGWRLSRNQLFNRKWLEYLMTPPFTNKIDNQIALQQKKVEIWQEIEIQKEQENPLTFAVNYNGQLPDFSSPEKYEETLNAELHWQILLNKKNFSSQTFQNVQEIFEQSFAFDDQFKVKQITPTCFENEEVFCCEVTTNCPPPLRMALRIEAVQPLF